MLIRKFLTTAVFFALIWLPARFASAQSDKVFYEELKKGFESPPSFARPKVYWWILNGNFDTSTAKKELLDFKNAGIAGFDFFEIGVRHTDSMIPGGPAFLSDQSLRTIKWVVDKAKELGLEMGLNLASSWNAGGAWVTPKDGGKSIYQAETTVTGNGKFQQVSLPFPKISFPKKDLIGGTGKPMIPLKPDGRPQYYEEIAVLAIPSDVSPYSLDTSKVVDVTSFFNPSTDQLRWKAPQGSWRIIRYVCSNSGQELVLPSPLSAGLTIDHFDSTAVKNHLMHIIQRLQTVLGNDFSKTPLKSFYLASYEARGLVWSSTLPDEFKRLNGYSITKFLPVFFDSKAFNKAVTNDIQIGFRKTLSEMMINNLYKQAKRICNKYGLKINSEAGGPGYPIYNGPAEPLKALGAIDLPRGEFWINHKDDFFVDPNSFSETYKVDIFRVVKEVSAASHIYGRGVVEEEAFTSFQNWQEGPFDMKPWGDRAFSEGMNRVVFHGSSHSPAIFGYPGVVYHAGTHFNNKTVWWPMVKPFIDYLSRLSYIFQKTHFKADVLFYYGDKIPNAGYPKNSHFIVGPGYDYEIINTEVLLKNLTVDEKGQLVLSNNEKFSMLALENEEFMNPHVLVKLKELVKKGAKIVGTKPLGVLSSKDFHNQKDLKSLIDQLWGTRTDFEVPLKPRENKIFAGVKPIEMIQRLGILPDLNYDGGNSQLIDYIHYHQDNLDFYFIRNTSDQLITRELQFRQKDKNPELWDPVTGKVVPISVFNQNIDGIRFPITLPPFGSSLIVFRNNTGRPHFTSVYSGTGVLPEISYDDSGFEILNSGNYRLLTSGNEKEVQVLNEDLPIYGTWKISFPPNWGAPESATFDHLISWTESPNKGIKYFSGIAMYDKYFQFKKNLYNSSEDNKIYLNLGDLSKIARVWLNGKLLGITWTKPYRFDVTNFIQDGENHLAVEIANTWANRIIGDIKEGTKFTNTNIQVSRTGVPWNNSPLIKSGLLGPVSLQIVKTIPTSL